MNEEQKAEWLAAAKAALNGKRIQVWMPVSEKWDTRDLSYSSLSLLQRYRPKPQPQMIRVYWDDDECGAVFDCCKIQPRGGLSVLVSTDDLLKIDKSGDNNE